MRCKKPQSVHSEDDHSKSTKSQSKMGAGAVTGMITRGQYSAVGEHARRLTPPALQCALLCGGANCRYERPQRWPPDQLALQGVYSHWITEDVLAMARPSTASIATWNIIQQFHSWGIRSVINLQAAGEHARCGPPLEASGFTYDPSVFMNNNIYYYNFAWRDYGCAGLRSLLDAVKVLSFAVGEGRVAVHCHAGLGRTGVLIACYLVRERRLRADDAIALVRERRSRAVQTKLQVESVHHFERYLLPQTVLFSIKEPPRERNKQHEFGLLQHLHRQKATLHGQEERTFRFLPKIIYFLCERLLRSCSCEGTSYSGAGNVNYVGIFTSSFLSVLERQMRLSGDLVSRRQYCAACKAIEQAEEEELNKNKEGNILESIEGTSWAPLPPPPSLAGSFDDSKEGSREGSRESSPNKKDFKVATAEQVAEALLLDYALLPEDWQRYLRQFQADLNSQSAAFTRINTEHDLRVIAALVLEWLEGLKMPILDAEDLATIVIWGDRPQECLLRLELEDAILVEYLVSVISRLDALPCATRCALVRRLSSALTQRPVRVRGVPLPSKSSNRPLRSGTAARLSGFLARLSTVIMSREATCGKCDKRDVLPAIMPAKKSPSKQTKLSFTPRKKNILHNAIVAGQNEASL